MDINGKQPLRQNAGARNTGLYRHLGSTEHSTVIPPLVHLVLHLLIHWSSLPPKPVDSRKSMPQIQTICLALVLSLPSCY